MRTIIRHKKIWAFALLAALLLGGCGQAKPAPTEPPVPTVAPATPKPTPDPTPQPTPEPTPKPTPASPTDIVDVPASPSDLPTPEPSHGPVDDSFFADAAFMGNSLMDGLHYFGGLQYGDFYAGTSASVISVTTTMDCKDSLGAPSTMLHALLEKQYRKIFVLFGVNELGFYVDGFVDIYAEVLAQIAAGEPDATIYILSLTPVTLGRSSSSDQFTKERVLLFNEAIKAMAERDGYEYMDLFTAMADENGYLPQNDSTDGVHFTASKYLQWADFLRCYPYA